LAGIRIYKLRGLLSIPANFKALSFPRLKQKKKKKIRVTKHFPGSAKLIIRWNVLRACCPERYNL